jgi:DNA-binding MarR family transcriptional regulator
LNDQTDDRIDALIRDLTDEMSRGYRVYSATAGLNFSDLLAIRFVRDSNGQATPTMLGKHLGMTSGATAILLNRLEKAEYVRREQHPTDRRGTLIKLGGAALEKSFLPFIRDSQRLREAVLNHYTPAERKIIGRFLDDIVAALRERNAALEAELARANHKGSEETS